MMPKTEAGFRFRPALLSVIIVAIMFELIACPVWADEPAIDGEWLHPDSAFGTVVPPVIGPASFHDEPAPLSRAAAITENEASPESAAAFEDYNISDGYKPSYEFSEDIHKFLPMLRDDAVEAANWNNAVILGGALAAAIGLRQDVDAAVRDNTARHPERWGEGSKALGRMGEVQYQIPVLLAIYGVSVQRDDPQLHDFSAALISAYTITGLSTLAVKGIANTDRPSADWDGGQFGFPSFHASSSFAFASVVDEYYGYKAGVPAYILAGLISWSRIDERDHDLSDVVFGAALGYVIGHAVAGNHLCGDSRVQILPFVDPIEGTSGLMVDLTF